MLNIIDFLGIYCTNVKKNPNPITLYFKKVSGCVALSATYLTEDPGVLSLIPAQSLIFAEIDHEIIYTAINHPSADLRRVVVSYKRKYVQEVLVNH